MLVVQTCSLEEFKFKGLSGRGNLEKSNETEFCVTMGGEERSLVLLRHEADDGRGQNVWVR